MELQGTVHFQYIVEAEDKSAAIRKAHDELIRWWQIDAKPAGVVRELRFEHGDSKPGGERIGP
jgi:hypothetical protein